MQPSNYFLFRHLYHWWKVLTLFNSFRRFASKQTEREREEEIERDGERASVVPLQSLCLTRSFAYAHINYCEFGDGMFHFVSPKSQKREKNNWKLRAKIKLLLAIECSWLPSPFRMKMLLRHTHRHRQKPLKLSQFVGIVSVVGESSCGRGGYTFNKYILIKH